MKFRNLIFAGKTFYLFVILSLLFTFTMSGSKSASALSNFTAQIKKEDSAKSLRVLEEDIDKLLESSDLKTTKFGIAVWSCDTKKFYYRKNSGDALIPASVTKLFTCFSALYKYGNDFKVKTQIFSTGEIKNGVLEGDLYIVGHGDALFSTDDLMLLVKRLKNSGIKGVNGNIYADGSYFDDINDRFKYSGDKDQVQGLQPITALSLEQNIITVNLKAGPQGGQYVSAESIPPSDAIKLSVTAKVRGSVRPQPRARKGGRSEIIEHYSPEKFGGPLLAQRRTAPRQESSRGLNLAHKNNSDGTISFSVSGSSEPENFQTYKYHNYSPVLTVAGALRNRLIAEGISVKGTFAVKELPDNKQNKPMMLAEFARPVQDIMSPLLKNSDNYMAETIFKIVGAEGKLKNNAKEAQNFISFVLDTIKANCEDCGFNDGSGLSRRNKVSAQTIVKMLNFISGSKMFSSFDSCMSFAAVDGTLKNRFTGTLAENNVHAKTGTHSNVSALAGYVKTLDGERLAFAFIFNGFNAPSCKALENELGALLARFFYFNVEK